MEKSKKIKIFIGLFYVSAVSLILYFFFSKFSLQEITSYEFIKNNRDYFFELKKTNLFLLGFLFILFAIIWVLAAGFGSPLALMSGFIFGKWLGLFFAVIGMTIGATLLYIFANSFLKDIIRDKFLNKFSNLEKKFKKSEFIFLLIYRFVGGIPFAIQNVLPCMFNVKVRNYFWSTLLGIIPSVFLTTSIGNGLETIIDKNLNAPSAIDLISSPSIYLPLLGFLALLIITIISRNFFYKN